MEYFKDLEVDFKGLCVILDVDGTITYDAGKNCVDCQEKITDVKNHQNTIYLCSNGDDKERLVDMAKSLGVNYIVSKYKKPNKKVLDEIDIVQNKVVVIGDKILTDGLLAKRLNVRFIKVRRLFSKRDSLAVKIFNFLDDVLSNLRITRPNHWIKNLFIFAPLFFAGRFFNVVDLLQGLHLFIAFCALASAVYVFNDLKDRNADKLHLSKRTRPLASGEMTKKNAIILIVALLMITVLMAVSFPISTIVVMMSYLFLNLLYSVWLKHIPIVDIFLVASMYIIRIYAGGAFYNIRLSAWIILCTFFLALFLVIAKRKAEFNALDNKNETRKVMQLYNNAFLDHMLTISVTFSLVSYSLYLVSFNDSVMLYAFFFVLFGMMRYLYLVYRYNLGQSPESIVVKDPWMIASILGWIIYNAYFLY